MKCRYQRFQKYPNHSLHSYSSERFGHQDLFSGLFYRSIFIRFSKIFFSSFQIQVNQLRVANGTQNYLVPSNQFGRNIRTNLCLFTVDREECQTIIPFSDQHLPSIGKIWKEREKNIIYICLFSNSPANSRITSAIVSWPLPRCK